jgi:hypothetical protein
MRWLTWTALLVAVCGATAAPAGEQTIRDIATGSAVYSGKNQRAIIVQATVDLPNSCWSHPRFQRPARGVRPDADGVVPLTIVADSAESPGVACSMIFRQAPVPPLHWTTFPKSGLKAVKLIGARRFITAQVEKPDEPQH